MVTYNEYLRKILLQILDSYAVLREIKDRPGDLDGIRKEMLKINGFLKVISNKIDPLKITSPGFKTVRTRAVHYLENYYFEQEIDTMSPLYSDDTSRIRNMRLKILEALDEGRLMEEIRELIEKI